MDTHEKVIWVDEQDKELGVVSRVEAHDENKLLIHRETMELLFADKTHTTFWLQKRSPKKDQYPGFWTLSVTCHVNPEDILPKDKLGYLTAGAREGREELGVEIINQQLVGVNLIETDVNRAMSGIIVAEYLGKIIINQEEIDEVKLFNKETVEEVVDKLTPAAKEILHILKII